MRYRSTRGDAARFDFLGAVMTGLAPDGGLLVPETIPDVRNQLAAWRGLTYQQLACEIISRYSDDLDRRTLADLVDASYRTFDHPAVTPLVAVGDFHVLELFHGPTLAFKDVALQFLGNVFSHVLARDGGSLNIFGATSGDTGSAAIAGVRGKPGIRIFIMFPEGKTSPVQERQMTTVQDENVFNLGILGSFDDCQSLLKSTFGDLPFKQAHHLGAVNSVNWARVLAQVVYYFSAWYQLGEPDEFDVAVPTGNFGNIFAGYLARRMGLPVGRLILATNQNDILARFFRTGIYQRGDVAFTLSPAMDIQVSSNFERYLYYRFDNETTKVREFMATFARSGSARFDFNTPGFDSAFVADTATDADTVSAMRDTHRLHSYLLDPHTAVGVSVGLRHRRADVPLVCLATAHPAKFDDAVERALPGMTATHPSILALEGLPTRKEVLPNDLETIKDYIHRHT